MPLAKPGHDGELGQWRNVGWSDDEVFFRDNSLDEMSLAPMLVAGVVPNENSLVGDPNTCPVTQLPVK